MAIWGVFGGLGQGKTVTALHFLNFWNLQGKPILSNVHLGIPYQYMDMELIYEKGKNDTEYFKNKVLFIDEMHLLMESRRSGASVNVDFSQNILIQLGKLDCTFIYTSQLLSQVDLRIREMTKYFIFCSKVSKDGQMIDSDLRVLPFDILIDLDIIIQHSDTNIERQKATLDPKHLFNLYDTREIIQFDRDKFLKK